MNRALRLVVALAAAAAGLVGGVPPAAACADGHLGLRWVDFGAPLSDLSYPFFYFAGEGDGQVTVTIMGVGDDCRVPAQPVTGTYEVTDPESDPRAATSALDYQPVPAGNTGPLYGYHAQGPTRHSRDVTISQDLLPEAVAEHARALITFSSGRLEVPWEVPLQIIDDDGPSRVSFESTEVAEKSETYPTLSVAVLRAGPADTAETFEYTAEGTSADPASAADYTLPSPRRVEFAVGERVKLITVGIVNDTAVEPDEELTITLTSPGPIIPDTDPASATIRILDNEESGGVPPSTKFHHPRHRLHYERGDYRLREFHVFANDDGEVAGVELALRRNQEDGSCAWFSGKRFVRGACAAKRWLDTDYYPDLDWYYYRMDELKPSVGTSIKSYTAFARGTDGAGNVERRLEVGRNANTFEVEKR